MNRPAEETGAGGGGARRCGSLEPARRLLAPPRLCAAEHTGGAGRRAAFATLRPRRATPPRCAVSAHPPVRRVLHVLRARLCAGLR